MEAVNYLDAELFSFAYFPDLYVQLHALKEMALPEAWRFKAPPFETMNRETPILERYLRDVFRFQAMAYNEAEEPWQADMAIYMAENIACFHTGFRSRFLPRAHRCAPLPAQGLRPAPLLPRSDAQTRRRERF